MLLTEQERETMSYYLQEYQEGHICVEPLAMALFELFNTQAKVQELSADKFHTFPHVFTHLTFSIYLFFYCPTHHQLSLLSEVRGLVASHDLELYDRLVLTHETGAHQAWRGGLGVFHPPCDHAASVIQTAGNTILPLVNLLFSFYYIT